MTSVLRASTDRSSITLSGKEFNSLIVRAIKLYWYLFVLAVTQSDFLEWNCLVLSPFMYREEIVWLTGQKPI